jgi:uncharacterized protein
MTRRIVVLFTLLLAALPLRAQGTTTPDAATLTVARNLLTAMKAGEAVIVGMDKAMVEQKASAPPQVPPLFFDRVGAAFRSELPALLEDMAKTYAAHFSKQEMEQLTTFYRTPIGVRLATESGPLGTELAATGQRWGAALAMRVMGDMIEKGEMTMPQ